MPRARKKHGDEVGEAVKIVELLGSHYSLLKNILRSIMGLWKITLARRCVRRNVPLALTDILRWCFIHQSRLGYVHFALGIYGGRCALAAWIGCPCPAIADTLRAVNF